MSQSRSACIAGLAVTVATLVLLLPLESEPSRQLADSTVGDPRSSGQSTSRNQDRFRHSGTIATEHFGTRGGGNVEATEALTGFDNLTNGTDIQGPPYSALGVANVTPLRSFNDNRFIFEEVRTAAEGIGPTYNAQSCRECHQNVVTGAGSQVAEQRSGRSEGGQFFASQGGSLIHSRATHPDIVEHVGYEDGIRTFRLSTPVLGDGYVEAVANETLLAIREAQPESMRGTAVIVPVFEGDGTARIGRFGWKSQHASLLSFSADASLNELGVTSPLLPEENTAGDRWVGFGSGFDAVADPEDDGMNVQALADFMRSTRAPSRGPITEEVVAGELVFNQVGCVTCHVASVTTAPAGTSINGGAFTVPMALGNKIIHPYSDFLLHDIGTGDGIPVQATPDYASTANQIRTAPLWGLRIRNRLMHDGLSLNTRDAIARHAGQAAGVTASYEALSKAEKSSLLQFLDSL